MEEPRFLCGVTEAGSGTRGERHREPGPDRAGSLHPEELIVDGHELVIESGVGRDGLSSGMAVHANEIEGSEVFALTELGFGYLISAVDRSLLIGAGVLEPDA